jgi:hypothetical protein
LIRDSEAGNIGKQLWLRIPKGIIRTVLENESSKIKDLNSNKGAFSFEVLFPRNKCMLTVIFDVTSIGYSTIETKAVARIGYNGFLFPHEGRGA